ncbi:MAG: MazG family protein, partial [Clostridia bacterium]|nr:MazG family protein [Clostridia bacterium]
TIAGERCAFTLRDVTTGIVNKLIYRHPHVYQDARVRNSEDVLVNWESLKKKEKHFETQTEVLEAVPKNFPALIRAHKVQKKAAHVGFDWDDPSGALAKVREEADEVQEALANGTNLFEELGDLLFAAVNVSRLCGEEAEPALKAATDKFVRRFGAMEKLILENGRTLEGMSLEEMDNFWDEAKRREKCCENA